jgi:tetratricopeptide (TPR) repeat protein
MSANLVFCKLLLCAGIMILLTGCCPSQVDYYSTANNLQNAGKYRKAIDNYNCFICLNPQYAHAYYSRGYAYAALGKYDRAITDFDRALTINPDLPEVYVKRGDCYKNKSQYDQALTDYSEAIKTNPAYAEAYLKRAAVYNAKGRYDLAVADYNTLIDSCPDNLIGCPNQKIYTNRAVAYYHLGEYEKAWLDIDKLQIPDFRPNYAINIDQDFLHALRTASGRAR